jgi:hypothetical protein
MFSILKVIYAIYEFIALKIFLPIMDRVEISALSYRIRHLGEKDYKISRFRRMQLYKYNKAQKEIYKENMETIAKISDETRIPQYILLETFDLNRSMIVYNGKNDKQEKYSILEPIYYIYKLLPSFKQATKAVLDLLIYFKQRWIEYVWKRFEGPYFYHWTRRVLSYRLRGNDPKKIFFIGYRWEVQKYYREKRLGKKLRREKQIKHQMALNKRLQIEAQKATIGQSNI